MKIKLVGLMLTFNDKGHIVTAQYQRDQEGVVDSRIAKLTLNDEATFALSVLQQSVFEAVASVESKVERGT